MLETKKRIYILIAAVVVVAVILSARLAQMQLFWHKKFKQDYQTPSSGDQLIDTVRGNIYSANGKILARDAPRYDLSLHYPRLKDSDWLKVISKLTKTPEKKLEERRKKIIGRVKRIWNRVKERTGIKNLRILEQQRYHPVVKDISPKIAAAVRTKGVQCPGLKVTVNNKRVYPSPVPIPHIIGRISRISPEQWKELNAEGKTWTTAMPVSEIGKKYKMNDKKGITGIEKFYEDKLRGKRGYITHELDFYPLEVKKVKHITEPKPGLDVHLTLRLDFQKACNNALRWAANNPKMDFQAGALVIIDVHSGAVLAAATWPTYTRTTYTESFTELADNKLSPLLFRPSQAALPTGSVFKLITAIAGLEEGKISKSTTFNCQHRKKFNNRWFHCVGHHGRIRIVEAIKRSCNIFFFSTASRLQGKQLEKWAHKFGFGINSGLDLPFSKTGFVPQPTSLFGKLNFSIGQGKLLCTPFQVARACAAIADNGQLSRVHFMKYLAQKNGKIYKPFKSKNKRIPISQKTLNLIKEGMYKVVNDPGGTASGAGLKQFRAAGKTGTAELGPDQPNHAWFTGFAPYKNPEIAFAVVNERTSGHGGSHAAPILARALEKIWPTVGEKSKQR